MRKYIITICIFLAGIFAATWVQAPSATADGADQAQHIYELQQANEALQASMIEQNDRVSHLETTTNQLTAHVGCLNTIQAVTQFIGPDGHTYLDASKNLRDKHTLQIIVLNDACKIKRMTKKDLQWSYPPSAKKEKVSK